MMNEYCILNPTTAQSILFQLHKLPYGEIQPLADEIIWALQNTITLTPQPQQCEKQFKDKKVGFIDTDDFEYNEEEQDDNNKIIMKKK